MPPDTRGQGEYPTRQSGESTMRGVGPGGAARHDLLEEAAEIGLLAPIVVPGVAGEIGDLVALQGLGETLQDIEHQTRDPLQGMRPVRPVVVDENHLAAGDNDVEQGVGEGAL